MSKSKTYSKFAPYYDILYTWKDYEKESKKVAELLEEKGQREIKEILEVACGTGNYIVPLGEKYQMTGLDLNGKMLEVARRKCPGVDFYRADMISFELERRFDAILCLFSSIGHLKNYENLARTFERFAEHLRTGGVAIVEPFVHPDCYVTGRSHGIFAEEGDVQIARFNESKREGMLAILEFQYLIADDQGVHHYTDREEMALYDPERAREEMEKAGFEAQYLEEGLMENRGLLIGVKP